MVISPKIEVIYKDLNNAFFKTSIQINFRSKKNNFKHIKSC